MSHYTVKFEGTPREMTAQAWLATCDYLEAEGLARLTSIRTELAQAGEPRRVRRHYARLFCMFNGIQGYYPQRAVTAYVLGLGQLPAPSTSTLN